MVALLVLFFSISIVFSFLCSLWEAVLLSITPAYAERHVQAGDALGHRLVDFKADIDRPLAAILTLNTIAHTVGAIGVGQQATAIWAQTHPLLTGVVVPTVMTLVILVLSEIVPKTLGAVYWQGLAPFTVRSLGFLLKLLAPFVWMSRGVTALLKRGERAPVLTRSDFTAMAEIGAREGVLDDRERRMLDSLLSFRTVEARDVMTPRTVVVALPEEERIVDVHRSGLLRFSRLPTYHSGSKDRITGFVLRTDVLSALAEGKGDARVGTLRRELLTIQESYRIVDLLQVLMDRKEHIALVLDDFGGMAGVVTLEDALETLIGMEIVDETDEIVDMRQLARKQRDRRAAALKALQPAPVPAPPSEEPDA
ncbi:MAG: CNNM domain-containing protein [Pseudomonadales bacterium]|jgi:CBS domain containing-hemolysin-like protein|nr:CNNM domain-containing protein [Pseudomonadales bacterium]